MVSDDDLKTAFVKVVGVPSLSEAEQSETDKGTRGQSSNREWMVEPAG